MVPFSGWLAGPLLARDGCSLRLEAALAARCWPAS